ncbi:p53 DNA-binding domain protein [Trichostrongylus colubriformis]|uniref:P53 DNA-binding domain protein n=1 Tax=Trichostrongylus colubriformis TaxID=6319 RepID=A0AAN8GFF3_TRICO
MQTRSTAANTKTAAQQAPENQKQKVEVVGSHPPASSYSDQRPQQPEQHQQEQSNSDQWTSSSESVVTQQPYVQNSASTQNMVRPAQVSNSMLLNPTRLHYQLPHHPAFPERVFSVGITPQTKSSKNLDYVVTRTKGGLTLYSKSELMIPFVFTYTNNCNPNSTIRVHAEYTEERYANKAVERCPNHQYKDASPEIRQHFVRCEHVNTDYVNKNGTYFVRIPMCDSTSFAFTCFSSCSGGINRRPLQLVFTLETPTGKVQDMCHVALKVCANPLRDSSKEDDKMYSLDSPCDPFGGMGPRRRALRPDEAVFKRGRGRYCDDSCFIFELHLNDFSKFRKFLWYMANEDKIDQLVSMNIPENPFRQEESVLSVETPFKYWLNRQGINIGAAIEAFDRRAIITLGDLARVYRPDLFSQLGIDAEQCNLLTKAFQEWYMVNRRSIMDMEGPLGDFSPN